MSRWGIVLLLLLPACGTFSLGPGAASASRTATAARTSTPIPYASGIVAVVAGSNSLSLVDSAGAVKATTSVTQPAFRPNAYVSWTSASLTRLHYLNAGYEVRFLGIDGSSGLATQITVQQDEQAGFAVSPDEKRIAVSILSYARSSDASQPPAYRGMRLFVEDLHGGGHHLDIFDSRSVAEFPIGWVGGNLLLAVSTSNCCQTPPFNPYGAMEFHIANPDTGQRLVTLCSGTLGPEGPIEPFGVMCNYVQSGGELYGWSGNRLPPPAALAAPGHHLNAASPDGHLVAIGQAYISIWGSPIGTRYQLNVTAYVYGWLDSDHMVIRKEGDSFLSIYDLRSRSSVDVPGGSSYLGTVPTPIS